MNTLTTPLRTFATRHDPLPALRAANLLLLAAAAALFHLGVFALFVVVHILLDIYKYSSVHRFGTLQTLAAVLRESLRYVLLMLIGFCTVVYLHPSLPGVASLSGLLRTFVTLLHGMGVFIPKFLIVRDFSILAANVPAHLADVSRTKQKGFLPGERVMIFALCMLVMVLGLAPSVLGTSLRACLAILAQELSVTIL